MKYELTGAIALVFALCGASARAEESPYDTDRAIIVTGHRAHEEADARAAATPGGTDVVAYDDYADRSLVSLRDVLAFSPGVYLQPRYGQEIRISIRGSGLSRGFHMRGLTLLQDGVPINLADDNGDFQELEPTFFDHLEVYRGANALRFGSGTLGGAINGVTPTGRTAEGLYARGDIGSFETYRGLVSAGARFGPGDAWGAISYDSSDGDRDHARRRSLRFHGNVGLELAGNVETRFYASINSIEQELPGALSLNDARTNPRKGNFTGDQARDIESIRLQNRTRIMLGQGKLDIGLFLNSKQLFHPIFQVIDQKSNDYGAYARLDQAWGPVEITLGGEIRRGSTRARQFVNVNGANGALTFEADQDARTANLYGEVRVKPVERLSLIAGAIYADGFRKRQVLFSTAPTQDGRVAFDTFSPKFGLLFEPASDIQLFANYSRSAEMPGFGEVFQTVGTTSTLIAGIQPQRAWTAEIGTRGRIGIASWDLSVYRSDIEGELLQYTVSADIPASTFNAGRTRHQGVEAGLDLDFAPWLRLRQTYMYSDFRFRGDAQFGGNRLPVVPEHMYRAEIRLGTDRLHVAPHVEWVPQGPFADYRNQLKIDGYALLGVSAGASVMDGVDLFLDARNLTDRKAAGDISAAITATPASAIFYPVERRAVFGGVRARF